MSKELLQAAADAAKYEVRWVDGATRFNYTGFKIKLGTNEAGYPLEASWNPLTNNADAFKLAVDCQLLLAFNFDDKLEAAWMDIDGKTYTAPAKDKYHAARLAIVNAAALS